MEFAITTTHQTLPHAGQKVFVRNRPALVRSVVNHDHPTLPAIHEVQVDYIDNWSHPDSDTVIWEVERNTKVLNRLALPEVEVYAPDQPELLRAFLYAHQWSAVNRLAERREEDEGEVKLISPWQSAVQVEDYQLSPVLKSLLMPRISLLLADDVGLGKTVETGLILSELFVRRRIRRVLIICPASLQLQWRDEMREKFHLDFTIVDRDETFKLQRELGIDSNPWSSYPRIITSMDYLRQRDVQAAFIGATRKLSGHFDALLPWQMLVVDEVHNLAPANYGDNSDRCEMLRTIAPFFEHRLFLSATPHNGFTVSFTGLLELLDPVRFQQKARMDEQDKRQLEATMVRRLKVEMNEEGMPDRFASRAVSELKVSLPQEEHALFEALRKYRYALQRTLQMKSKREHHLGEFLIKLLTKRLLSSSYAFARTWWRHVDGLEGQEVQDEDVASHSIERAEMMMNDDQERGQREDDAVKQTGSWLRRYAHELRAERQEVSRCLQRLGWSQDVIAQIVEEPERLATVPLPVDARWTRLQRWIDERLRRGGVFRTDERLIVFTEYKHTLDYLMVRLYKQGYTAEQATCLFGGASSTQREAIKEAFNDPSNPLRILVGTDTVSEGISLQMTCRYVIHQEIPWNPMRLEQRNGRVDRHGQERDVEVFYFTSDDEEDLKFIEHVVNKVKNARKDLGSVGQVIDETVEEYFTQGLVDAKGVLDSRVEAVQVEAQDIADMETRDRGNREQYTRAMQRLNATEMDLNLSREHIAGLLTMALHHEGGELEAIEGGEAYRLKRTPASWKKLVKETLERQSGYTSGLPKLVFDPEYFEVQHNGRRIFKPRLDAELIRLAHPLMQRALGVLRRRLWDTHGLFRWTIESCRFSHRMQAILVMHLFLEVTNEFREVAHQEVLTLPFEVRGARLQRLEDPLWLQIQGLERSTLDEGELASQIEFIRTQWSSHQEQLRKVVEVLRQEKIRDFTQRMHKRHDQEHVREQQIFNTRLQELEAQKEPKNLQKLKSELEREQKKLKRILQKNQQLTWDTELQMERQQEQTRVSQRIRALEFDQERAEAHVTIMKGIVEQECERILKKVLPKRYTLAAIDLQPLTVEYIVPASGKEHK